MASFNLYNSLTQNRDPLVPLEAGHIKMYACGPTVYDRAHLGNARSAVVFDIVYRALKEFYQVTYVRNITDIDDKIIDAAQKSGRSIDTITKETTAAYHQDMAALHTLPPTIEPRATQYVPHMIDLIQRLVALGYAYPAEGHVLYRVKAFSCYGCLSKRTLDDMMIGARVEVAPYKENPLDFVLWKPSDDSIPGWPSPWGRGRPGWHIECSAMSLAILGDTFDIHGGGQDLMFPHHENEIAQSQALHGVNSYANVWLHNGILTVNGEKMSKSLGNFMTVEDLLHHHRGETIRLAIINTHYRQPLNWTASNLNQAKAILDKLYTALTGFDAEDTTPLIDLPPPFIEALQEDFNTPHAIQYLHFLAGLIFKTNEPQEKKSLQEKLYRCGQVLGLFNDTSVQWFQVKSSLGDSLTPENINQLITQRQQARQNRDFKAADEIRQYLHDHGVTLEDSPGGTTWKWH